MNKAVGGALVVVAAVILAVAVYFVKKNEVPVPAPNAPKAPMIAEAPAPPAPPAAVEQIVAAPAAPDKPAEAQTAPAAPVAASANMRSIAAGAIQAEDYDEGGEGKGFHDTTASNMYGNYRQDAVDIETFSPGAFSVGSIAPGEWLAYTLNVPESAEYELDFHTATPRAGNQIVLNVDGVMAAPAIIVPATTGWGEFQTFIAPASLKLTAGAHSFRLSFPQGFVNIDWFEFNKINTKWPAGGVAKIRTIWDLTNKAAEGTTVTLKGQSPDNGGRWRATGVTDANGELGLEFPEFAKSAQILAQNLYSRQKALEGVALPAPQQIVIRLERETTLFGTTVFAGGGKPAAGAVIEALGSGKTAKSDKDGAWEIVGLDPKSIRLIASKDELVSYKDESEIPTILITAGAPNGPHHLVLKPGPMLTGRVTDDESGQGVAGAKMSARLQGAEFTKVHETKSGADGRYAIPGLWGDRYMMEIDSEEYVVANEIMALGMDTQAERDFALEPGATVHATVKDLAGQPVKDAQFYVIVDNNWNDGKVKTDEKGQADIKRISRKVKSGVAARGDGYTTSESQIPLFEEGARETSMAFEITKTEKKEDDGAVKLFVGRVTDKDTNPVAGAVVRWGDRWNLESQSDKAETDADGRYRLEAKRPNYGNSLVAVTAEGFAPAWQTNISPGTEAEPREVNFTLDPAHWLNVSVVDEEKNPVADAIVSIQVASADSYGNMNVPGIGPNKRTDDQGKLRLENLPGPTVMASASKSGYTGRDSEATAVDTDVTIELKPAAVILGRLLDKVTKTPISSFNVKVQGNSIDYERTRKGESVSDRDGRFKLSDLAMDSPYSLTFSAEGYPPSVEKDIPAKRESEATEKEYYITKGTGLTIELTAAGNESQLIAGAEVYAAMRNPQNQGSYRQYQWDDLGRNDWMWQNVETKMTNEIGRVTFDEGSEKQTLFIRAKGWERLYIEPTDRARFKTDDASVLRVALQPESVIEGTYSLKGQPQTGQTVNLSRSGNNYHEGFGNKKAGSDGRFEFDSLGAGEYSLNTTKVVNNRGYSTMNKRVSLKSAERLNVVLGEDLGPYSMHGKITRDGKPLHNANAGASNEFGWDYTSLSGQADEEGKYLIEGLKPGTYNVYVHWNDNTGRDYLNKSEKITISGDLEKDFEFGGAFKVIAKLKFPETMPVEVRARYRSALLQFVGNWSEMQKEGLEGYKSINFTGDTLEFKGRFRGKYNLSLNYNLTNNQATNIPVPGSPFEIDTTAQDQDLGELTVPMPGGVKMELVFERPENKERYTTVNLNSTQSNTYIAPNPDGITFNANAPIGENPHSIPGRFKGEYRISVSRQQDGFNDSVPVPQMVTVADPNVETDLGRVVVPPVFDVRGRLVMPDDQQDKFTKLVIRKGELDGPSHNPEGLTFSAGSPIGADGTFTVTGRFNGSYIIALGQRENINHGGEGFALPQTFAINNLEGDVDLGDIEMGGSGKVKIVMTHSDPAKIPSIVIGFIVGDAGATMLSQFEIRPGQPEQEIGPMPAGETPLRFVSPGFRVEPGQATVTVSPDDTPVITLTTTPEGMLLGMAEDAQAKGQPLPVTRVTLEGAGQSRTITPIEGTMNEILDIWSMGEDSAINSRSGTLFIFRDLPEGEYSLSIEATGYQPVTKTTKVVPGSENFGEMSIELVKTGDTAPVE